MHIHVPKPIHGWKQFFNEVFVIAIGIAIALSGEELLTHLRDDHQADRSLEAIEAELSSNLGQVKARLATADCVDRRLGEIAHYIEKPTTPRPSWVGRPQLWIMRTSAVAAARSYGSLTAMPSETQTAIAQTYASLEGFGDYEKDEQWAWAELRAITEDRDLSDSDRASLRGAIQRARLAAWAIRINGLQAIDEAKAIDVVPDNVSKGSQSVCIPMNTPFAEAARLSGGGYGEPR